MLARAPEGQLSIHEETQAGGKKATRSANSGRGEVILAFWGHLPEHARCVWLMLLYTNFAFDDLMP